MPEVLAARARLRSDIRRFFAQRGVMEVDTPLLADSVIPDSGIDWLRAGDGYLQSSPESAMKRLLADGCGDIYQIGHVFRAGEIGRLHAQEFTLLEWYRVGWTLDQLIDEVLTLCEMALGPRPVTRTCYAAFLETRFGFDPMRAGDDEVRASARRLRAAPDESALSRDAALDLLYATCVEESEGLCVVENFPPSQAALARIDVVDGLAVARRFEVIADGVELANGYHELRDPSELRDRFAAEHAARAAAGAHVPPLDRRLLTALRDGLPDCSGVALGFDRLLMLACGAARIADVMPG